MKLRNPRTRQEIAMNLAVARDPDCRAFGVRPPRRLVKNVVPTAWDDLPRETSRSWKKYRRAQWVARIGNDEMRVHKPCGQKLVETAPEGTEVKLYPETGTTTSRPTALGVSSQRCATDSLRPRARISRQHFA